MRKANTNKTEIGDFGPIYQQFKDKPKQAILHLKKVKKGECINALYRTDIGYIDIVWGENNKQNKGFGLKHIIEKHGKEIEQLGFKVEDFIPIVVQYGELKINVRNPDRILLESEMFRIIISKVAYTKDKRFNKTFVLSAFDLRPMKRK